MWNLSKGRCSYTAKLEAAADTIEFSPSGDVRTGSSRGSSRGQQPL
jgi:hypothetical protein